MIGNIKKYTTDILKKVYFEENDVKEFHDFGEENNVINVHTKNVYQKWLGMGGALTNSTANNFNKLSEFKKEEFLDNYYEDLNYSWLRIPLGSTDFSLKPEENYKESFDQNIEIIKKIKDKTNIKTILTPWSPPAKFKENNSLYGGKLKKDCYNEYANYLKDAINDYEFMNVNIDYISPQNEPFADQKWESCNFSIEELKEFIYNNLAPKLKNTKIILWDHNKDNLYNNFKELYENKSEIKGIAFHWYTGSFFEEMDLMRENYPSILQIETEMCCGFSKYNPKKWIKDAELYLTEIINGIHHGLNVFIDWNMLLDYKGGPNHKHNFCKSPIILNRKQNDYIKTPIYYYLKHIGMAKNADVIATSKFTRDCSIDVTALKNDKIYVIIQNKSDRMQKINVKIDKMMIKDKLNKHSIVTYVLE